MAEGTHIFDKAIQEANVWVKEIGDDMHADTQRAYHALRATLHVLRDRITLNEATDLAAQLPMLVKGIYYEGWRPHEQPRTYRSQDEFLDAVNQELGIDDINPLLAVQAVFKCIEHHCDPGEVRQVKQMLPEPVRQLWPH